MLAFESCLDEEWTWTRPRVGRRRFELSAHGELLASLESRAWLTSRMVATTSAGEWTLRHEGLFRGRVVLTTASGEVLVTFRPAWFGAGTAVCASGLELQWKRSDFWGKCWEFRDAAGLAQIAYERRPAWLRSTTVVSLSDAGRRLAEAPALALLGFYLLLMMQRQAQAAH